MLIFTRYQLSIQVGIYNMKKERIIMQFLNSEHEENFNKLLEKAKISSGDTERKALFFIVAGNSDLFK